MTLAGTYLTNGPAIEYLNLRASGARPVEALAEMARWREDTIDTRALAHVARKAPPQ